MSKILKNNTQKQRNNIRSSIKDLKDLRNFVTFYPASIRKHKYLAGLDQWIKEKEQQLKNNI
jgi:hypothetical protein